MPVYDSRKTMNPEERSRFQQLQAMLDDEPKSDMPAVDEPLPVDPSREDVRQQQLPTNSVVSPLSTAPREPDVTGEEVQQNLQDAKSVLQGSNQGISPDARRQRMQQLINAYRSKQGE